MPKQRTAMPAGNGAVPITQLLAEAGFTGAAAQRRARAVLEEGGLTRPGKTGIAAEKRVRALALLATRLAATCGDRCARLLADGREPVRTDGRTCEVCAGSNNRRAALAAARALRDGGITRVLVVGGTPPQQNELKGLFARSGITLTFVDGTKASHTLRDAETNIKRVQMVVIWGPTPLRHAVSELYTREPPAHVRLVTVNKRGIEALCAEIERNMRGGRRRG